MQITKTAPIVATATLIAAAALAPAASANSAAYSNTAGDVRCEIYQLQGTTKTICVSDTARQTQPECNPPGQLIPAVSVGAGSAEVHCWNQGFTNPPQKLNPLQVKQLGSAYIAPDFSGNLYVADIATRAVIRAGTANQVLFKL
ncbi:hypothetical protein NUW87_10775 [Corynebacterium pilbarense]|uniref:Uncharacterized protein n=1 Tax=Corynebacterium pilbarense TaxID=1288393 RepID=A0A9Q4NSU3_9CORY|nr:hypothetical protein [Corynebacterium pilbarense]MCZ2221845.1 hypothetical protein [Corynebacterium pilbarense]